MCRDCHERETILEQLHEQWDSIQDNNAQFDKWNIISIFHMIIMMSGFNGEEVRELSIKIFEKFVDWYLLNNEDEYFPKNGLENMYPEKCYRRLLEIAMNSDTLETPPEHIQKILYEEIEKYPPRKPVFLTREETVKHCFKKFCTGFLLGALVGLLLIDFYNWGMRW
jgi:hypothetical protein